LVCCAKKSVATLLQTTKEPIHAWHENRRTLYDNKHMKKEDVLLTRQKTKRLQTVFKLLVCQSDGFQSTMYI
jgi:hypothetical protein